MHQTKAMKEIYLSEKENCKYEWTMLGCRGSFTVCAPRFVEFGGLTNCSIIKCGTHALVLDCGTGLYEARDILSDCTKIDVLLSHVHYDHCLGLLDFGVFPKTAQLNFYGNFSEWKGEKTINELFAAPFWPVDMTWGNMNQDPSFGQTIDFDGDFEVTFFRSKHPNGAVIFVIKAGGKKFCIMVDCELSDSLPFDNLAGCDLLMYDGMYGDDEYEAHKGFGHSTWQEGCRLASKAKVLKLVVTHHNPLRSDKELLEIEALAKKIFPETVFARSGMKILF